jgi:hypothetical protein
MRQGDVEMRASCGVLVPLCCLLPAMAAIDGKVTNGTTGQPQSGVTIGLVQPGQQGMQNLGSAVSGADGSFRFDAGDPKGPAPLLLQATYRGVSYSTLLQPGQPRTGVIVVVYDASSKADGVGVDRHGILLEPVEGKLAVREFIFIENKGKQTFSDDVNGTYRFFLPADAGEVTVSITPPSGMALTRPAEKTADKTIRKISFPIRPGKTQIDLQYALPLKDPVEFSGNILHKDGITRLIIPRGYALEGKGLEAFAPEPTTQSPMYGVQAGPFAVKMTGKAVAPEPVDEDSGSPKVLAHRPRLYDRYWWVLGLGLAIMAVSLLAIANRGGAGAVTAAAVKKK